MSKELEALENIKQAHFFVDFELDTTVGKDYKEDLDIIETALKRLEELEKAFDTLLKENEQLKTSYLENLLNEQSKEYIYKKLKALEIIKETPEFAWYVKIYKDAYEMITDVKGFRVNESAEELQEKFDLLKEILL